MSATMNAVKEYMNVAELRNDIKELFEEVISSYEDDKYFVFTSWANEDFVEEMIDFHTNQINSDMCNYMHRDDTRIDGNFNNIRRDYEREHEGCYYSDLVRRLDEGLQDEQTNEDRDWVNGWFWSTYGTFGIKYNLETEICEDLYSA